MTASPSPVSATPWLTLSIRLMAGGFLLFFGLALATLLLRLDQSLLDSDAGRLLLRLVRWGDQQGGGQHYELMISTIYLVLGRIPLARRQPALPPPAVYRLHRGGQCRALRPDVPAGTVDARRTHPPGRRCPAGLGLAAAADAVLDTATQAGSPFARRRAEVTTVERPPKGPSSSNRLLLMPLRTGLCSRCVRTPRVFPDQLPRGRDFFLPVAQRFGSKGE